MTCEISTSPHAFRVSSCLESKVLSKEKVEGMARIYRKGRIIYRNDYLLKMEAYIRSCLVNAG